MSPAPTTTEQKPFRVLVVDDEPLVRDLMIAALEEEGFRCDEAKDGAEALAMALKRHYDVVVTDLRMPVCHGHDLAIQLLRLDARPMIAVLTGVLESRLAKDLILRGVDVIEFKPVSFPLFAAKIKATVARLSRSHEQPNQVPLENPMIEESAPVSLDEMELRLAHVSHIIPISDAAIEVYRLAGAGGADAHRIAGLIRREPCLIANVLQLANYSRYNPSTSKIVGLEEAIARIGQNQVADVALGSIALTALRAEMVSWMDCELLWKQSTAAGIALGLLVEGGAHKHMQQGLLAAAVMQGLGRVVLGTLYEGTYEHIVQLAREQGETLLAPEERVFSETHSETLARLLTLWGLPHDLCQCIRYTADAFEHVKRLSGRKRQRVELVKLSVLIGKIATGSWEAWDELDFPDGGLLEELQVESVAHVVEATRCDLQELLTDDSTLTHTSPLPASPSRFPALPYISLSDETFDFVAAVLSAMGFALNLTPNPSQHRLLNCLGKSPHELGSRLVAHSQCGATLVVDAAQQREFREFGPTICIPGRADVLQDASLQLINNCSPQKFQTLA